MTTDSIRQEIDRLTKEREIHLAERSKHDKKQRELSKEIVKQQGNLLELLTAAELNGTGKKAK